MCLACSAAPAPLDPIEARAEHDVSAYRAALTAAYRDTAALLALLSRPGQPDSVDVELVAKNAHRSIGLLWETSARLNEQP